MGTFLEDRVNSFLHNNGVVTGEVTIRMVSNTDKFLETRSGMRNRSVLCLSVFVIMRLCVCVCTCIGQAGQVLA